MTDLSKLMSAIDASDARVAQAEQAYAASQKIADHHKAILHDEKIGNDALKCALFLVNGQAAPHDAPALAENPKPEKRDALAECVSMIKAVFTDPFILTDRAVTDELKRCGHKFRLPTVRKALAAIGEESRAAAQTAGTSDATERTDTRSLPEATPEHSGGAGADNLDMPGFFRRGKAAAE